MKLAKVSNRIINLSDKPSVSLITKLKKNDLIIYEGLEWRVEFPPKKVQRGVWWIGLRNDIDKKYVRIVENTKSKMTSHEKKTMINNIKSIVEQFSHNKDRLLELTITYYKNLSEYNNYDEKDVREVMSNFPIEIIKKSGIPL